MRAASRETGRLGVMIARSPQRRTAVSPFLFIFITLLSDKIGESLVLPLLPYLLDRYQVGGLTLGLLVSSYSLAQFAAIPVIGALGDRYGRRPVLLACVLGTAVSLTLFGLSDALWLIFVARILDGITGGTAATAVAYIADMSEPEERTQRFGLVGAALGLGFIIGPTLGGTLSQIQLSLPIFVAAALAIANFGLGYLTLPESLPLRQRQQYRWLQLNPLSQIRTVIADRRQSHPILALALFTMAFAGFTSLFVLVLSQRFGWGPALASSVFVVVGVVVAVTQGLLLNYLVPTCGRRPLAVYGLITLAVGIGVMALAPPYTPWAYVGLYGAAAFLAGGAGVYIPCMQGIISTRASPSQQGQVLGSTQSLQSLASVLGPAIAGGLFDRYGVVGWLGSVLMLVAGAIALTLKSR